MADYRQIHTLMWKDPWFLDLEADAKLLFIYLFSNEQACLAGIYNLSVKVIAFETDLDRERIETLLDRFQEDGKVQREGSLTWVPNLMKYNCKNVTSPKIQANLRSTLQMIPDCELKRSWIAYYNGIVGEQYRMDTLSIPYPESESEHEQEHEQEQEQHDPTGTAVAVPTTKQEWLDWLEKTDNHPALVRRMCQVLFPNKDPPDYGKCGRIAKQLGTGRNGYQRLMTELWICSAQSISGNVLDYVYGKCKRNGSHKTKQEAEPVYLATGLRQLTDEEWEQIGEEP